MELMIIIAIILASIGVFIYISKKAKKNRNDIGTPLFQIPDNHAILPMETIMASSFILQIRELTTIPGVGIVAIGDIVRGTLTIQDDIEIVGPSGSKRSMVIGLTKDNIKVGSSKEGEAVTVHLSGISQGEVWGAQFLIKPH